VTVADTPFGRADRFSSPPVALAFGEVRHRRLRPIDHPFRYRAFFVRVSLAALEQKSGGPLFGINRRSLIGVHAADHGDGEPLRAWLTTMLDDAGIVADGEIWLHTFARVFGYSFKPVSFWFCHRADGTLAAVVAEVNNTFGERHLYLLADPAGAPLRNGMLLTAAKRFHVSPFCAVDGTYRFRFFTDEARTVARIDHDDREGPLLTTSLSGHFAAVTTATALRALAAYPLFSLAVIGRIHWHALILWLRRVPFYRKPPRPSDPLTRGTP
jgi:DUF1365 family protein